MTRNGRPGGRTALLLGLLGLLGGCAADAADDAEDGASAVTASSLTPAYWNVDADPASPSPGSEPLNVIITAKNLQLADIALALRETNESLNPLATWREVESGTGLDFVTSGGKACISVEKATIDGRPGSAKAGRDPQALAFRLGGCAGVLADGESHARAWESVQRRKCVAGVPGKECRTLAPTQFHALAETTWYLALSQEHVCKVDVDGDAKPWHCILPRNFQGGRLSSINGPTRPYASATGGYDQGRDDFVADLNELTKHRPWSVRCVAVPRPAGKGLKVPVRAADAAEDPAIRTEIDEETGKTILERVPWSASATHCTITAPPQG
ncbi:hypothetical protein BH11MYX4_BH11MYX4_15020 [soil metagenome]